MIRATALLLTVLTGFSGLVYEVTWQKYVATMLGSHSEATAAVLGIFLAGLAVGYAVFGSLVRRMVRRASQQRVHARLIVSYGIVEALIGAYAFVFPSLFHWVYGWTAGGFGGEATSEFVVDVVIVAGLLGPPTILLGATIPLLKNVCSVLFLVRSKYWSTITTSRGFISFFKLPTAEMLRIWLTPSFFMAKILARCLSSPGDI